jgi:cytochrome P450
MDAKRKDRRLTLASAATSLALAEIYIVCGALFRRFDFELYGTTREDVEAEHDLFIPRPRNMATLGIRVKAKC